MRKKSQKNFFYGLIFLLITIIILFTVVYKIMEGSETLDYIKAEQRTLPDHERVITNEYAFSKLFGYIRFYHPSDESTELDWNNFAVYGAENIQFAENDVELKQMLEGLYLPIAPTIKFIDPSEGKVPKFNIEEDTTYAWQHLGLGLDDQTKPSIYESERTKAEWNEEGYVLQKNSLLDEYPEKNEVIEVALTDNLVAVIPLTVGVDEGKTTGSTRDSKAAFEQLKSKIHQVSQNEKDPAVRYAAATIIWNNYQHFYPYFNSNDTTWETQLKEFLVQVSKTNTESEYYETVMTFLEKTEDAHAVIGDPRFPYANFLTKSGGSLPFHLDIIDGELIITTSISGSLFHSGDKLLTMENVDAEKLMIKLMKTIPGTEQFKEYMALQNMRQIPTKEVTIERNGTEKKVKLDSIVTNTLDEFERPTEVKEIKKNIWYVNLTQPVDKELSNNWELISNSKGIIFDLRGYPSSYELMTETISRLIDKPITGPVGRFHGSIYPDRQNPVLIDYAQTIEPGEKKYQGKIVFLAYSGSMSMSEYFLKHIQNNEIGTIIGETTAGIDGNVYSYSVPGKLVGAITILEILNKDKSQTHLIGVKPDILIERTKESILNNEDDYINRAMIYIEESQKK